MVTHKFKFCISAQRMRFALITLISMSLPFNNLLLNRIALADVSPTQQTNSSSHVDDYIRSLNYDPRRLLSVQENGSTESLPTGKGQTRDLSANKVIICKKEKHNLDKNLTDVAILRPTNGVIFPGALVRANRRLAEGTPDPIALPRLPLTISVDLPGLGKNGIQVVQDATNSTVQTAINQILETWNANPSSQGYINAARSSLNIPKAYSTEELALNLGFSAKWASNDVSAQVGVQNNTKTSSTVALFKQVFYTATLDTPSDPASVFAKSVTVDQLKQVVDSDNPPAYVRSVDYGRIIMVKMDTSSSETKVDLEGALNYATASGTQISADLKSKYDRIIGNSTFSVITLGGNAEVATQIVSPTEIGKLKNIIQQSAKYSRSNPGAPISYTVAFLKDNQIATIGFTTDYISTDCTEYNNGFEKIAHAGGYVADWQIDWTQPDANGNPVHQHWDSGNQTAGYTQQFNLPGDATNINIRAWADTGLAWNRWQEIMNLTLNGPDNKCYRATGTTLNRTWDYSCN